MVMYGAFLCEPIAGSETANTYLARRIYLTMCSYNLYHSSTRHGESHFVKKKKQQTWSIEENTVSFDQWPSTTPGAQKGPLNQGIGNMAVAFWWQSLAYRCWTRDVWGSYIIATSHDSLSNYVNLYWFQNYRNVTPIPPFPPCPKYKLRVLHIKQEKQESMISK